MKKLKLQEILLISLKERRAKRVQFDPRRTVIYGRNSTGKSCLLKSIYHTFGAEPHKIHPDWNDTGVISLIKFEISNDSYMILKSNRSYSIFDENQNLLEQFSRISKLSEFFAELFDFRIKLPDRDGNLVTPPPAYIFLPFYCDQDKSWQSNWASFQRLYLPKAKSHIVYYHTGIRPNEYYETKGKISIITEDINKIESESKIVRNMLKNLKEKLSEVDFDIDIESFHREIKQLLIECESLNKKQSELKSELSILYNKKLTAEVQLEITKKALFETKKDYEYAVDVLDDSVDCPTCGAMYENSFSERFGIAQDEQRCQELIQELSDEIGKVNDDIAKVSENFKSKNQELTKIEKLLHRKQGAIKLKDLIESEGKKEMKKLFENEIDYYDQILKNKLLELRKLEKILKSYEDKDRKKEIISDYLNYMKKFLKELNVDSLRENSYKRIDSSIQESGSATPRSLMAYYYSILYIMKSYASSAYCPIIIDSPNQQGQDSENLPRLLKFIIDFQPKDSQLIIGLEDTSDLDLKGKTISLTENRRLLQKEEYESVYAELNPIIEKSLKLR